MTNAYRIIAPTVLTNRDIRHTIARANKNMPAVRQNRFLDNVTTNKVPINRNPRPDNNIADRNLYLAEMED